MNEDKPLISVIMPTYNHAIFIREAIESVLNQTYSNLELIIIDNYSKDNTEQIVSSFTDSRIKYFKFANHGIIAASRNFGIDNSQGEYLTFIDSDDIWLPNKLNIQLEYLRDNPDVSLACCSLIIKSINRRYSNKIIATKSKIHTGYIYNQLLNFNFIPCASVMVKASTLNDTGCFDEKPEFITAEDWDLWLRIARENKITFIPKVLGIYRMHSTNLFLEGKRLERSLSVINKHFKRGWITKKQAERARANFYFREGWASIEKDAKTSRLLFYKALHNDKGNLRIYCVNVLGLFLSVFPFLCKFIKGNSLDRKINARIVNLQNL